MTDGAEEPLLLLRGPTGIRFQNAWLHAFLVGVPISGLHMREAAKFSDCGINSILETTSYYWPPWVVDRVKKGGVCVDEDY